VRLCRFYADGRVHPGTAHDGFVRSAYGPEYPVEAIGWLPPHDPPKLVGLALNYADHADELGLEKPRDPVLFFKPVTSLIGHLAPIVYPAGAEYLHYEAELGVVMGAHAHRVKAARALDLIRGYTIGNDVTVRDFVTNLYRPPVKAKGFDTFGPIGPWIVTGEIDNPAGLAVRTRVNGELRQNGNTKDLLFTIPEIIEFVSFFMTLEPGDVLLTGTPRGISHVYPGDRIEIEIEGIGTLENPVVSGAGGK
jgi:5-oxopent-3-ene-1,2,5-tricarboxylate decarboxylase/2-hydroxyhepta-2,4-diene-1,7-dioate isomerase